MLDLSPTIDVQSTRYGSFQLQSAEPTIELTEKDYFGTTPQVLCCGYSQLSLKVIYKVLGKLKSYQTI